MIKPFLIALQFLTRLPVRITSAPDERDTAQSLSYYPVVGLIIGAILAGLAWVLRDTPNLLSAGIILAVWVLITGGLHLDGLADSTDAWVGGLGDRDKTLAIMKDPNCGPAGVVSIVLLLLLKFAVLHAMIEAKMVAPIILAPLLGRAVLLPLFATTPYVRANGLGTSISAYLSRKLISIVFFLTLIGIIIFAGMNGLWLILITMVIFLSARLYIVHRIGGMTGDVAGALVEFTELSILILASFIY